MRRFRLATDVDGNYLEHIKFFTKDEIKLIRTYEITPEDRVKLFKRAKKGDVEAISILKTRLHVTINPDRGINEQVVA